MRIKKLSKKVFIFMAFVILAISFFFSPCTLKADLSVSNGPSSSIVETKTLSFPVVIQYYNGILYGASEVGDRQFLKSTDCGETWTPISTLIGNPRQDAPFFIDSQGNFFLYIYPNDTVIKSANLGLNWSIVFDFPSHGYPVGTTSKEMGMTEDNQENLYIGVYGVSNASDIWQSTDHGSSWTLLHQFNARHIHAVQFNPFNDALYAAVGDDDSLPKMGNYKSIDYGKTWIKISYGNYKTAALFFTQNYTYFGSDDPDNSQAFIARSSNDKDFAESYLLGSNLGVEWIDALTISPITGVLYALGTGTSEIGVKGIWASADEGRSWISIYKMDDTIGTLYHFGGISNFANGYWFIQQCQRPYYTVKLKDMTKSQIFQLEFSLQNQTDPVNYVATSQPLIDSSNYLSFVQTQIQNAQLSFVGVSLRQLVRNPSFEDGPLGGLPNYWSKVDYIGNNWTVTKDSSDKKWGNYSMAICGLNATETHGEVQQTYNVPVRGNQSLIVMYSAKVANQKDFMFRFFLAICYADGTSNTNTGYTIENESTNGWITTRFMYSLPEDANQLMARFQVGGIGKAWVDGMFIGVINGDSANVLQDLTWSDNYLNSNNGGELLNTTNPSITINSQTISYAGQVGDASSTVYYPVSGPLNGLQPIQTTSEGSNVFRVTVMAIMSNLTLPRPSVTPVITSVPTATPALTPTPTSALTPAENSALSPSVPEIKNQWNPLFSSTDLYFLLTGVIAITVVTIVSIILIQRKRDDYTT